MGIEVFLISRMPLRSADKAVSWVAGTRSDKKLIFIKKQLPGRNMPTENPS
jgi:hypothetical protein